MKTPMKTPTKTPYSVTGYRVLLFCGFALAGMLTVSLALSLTHGDWLRALVNGFLLWVTATLVDKNASRLREAEGQPAAEGEPPDGSS